MSTMINEPVTPEADPVRATTNLSMSQKALRQVDAAFNPTHSPAAAYIKMLAAALITACDELSARTLATENYGDAVDAPAARRNIALSEARRQAALAATHFETGVMFAVRAATAGV